jgi:hypothetical protein
MRIHPTCRASFRALITTTGAALLLFGCGSNGGGDPDAGPPMSLQDSREFRAIAGVSMGAYGAMNLGTKHSDLFSTIASLGGPVDMAQLLRDAAEDNFEVKAETEIPRDVGEDFTFDHLAPYPDRDTRGAMYQDLVIAFGNPFLHHPDAARRFLASDSEPATIGQDDEFGMFTVPSNPRGVLDGGDSNHDGLRQVGETPLLPVDVLLIAGGSLPLLASGAQGVDVGGRMTADLDGDGVYDVGEGIVLNLNEPFDDANGDGVHDAGESFDDVGLDGVAATGDFGEGDGAFDYDPDRAHWLEEDPLTRVAALDAATIASQRMYMDVGTKDEFEFATHYDHFVALLQSKGIDVEVEDGLPGNCADLPNPSADRFLVRYPAGHVGVASVDPDDLLNGNICGEATIWQRIISMIGFLNESFRDGLFGAGGDFDFIDVDFDDLDIDFGDPDVRGEIRHVDLPSPALAVDGGAAPSRSVVVYLPPAFFRTQRTLPAVYFLGGYGQKPEDFERIRSLFDALILSGQLQNMFFVFLPGDGGRVGSFYVNQSVPESQVPGIDEPTSGRYEDSILDDLIPAIERDILEQRVRHV